MSDVSSCRSAFEHLKDTAEDIWTEVSKITRLPHAWQLTTYTKIYSWDCFPQPFPLSWKNWDIWHKDKIAEMWY